MKKLPKELKELQSICFVCEKQLILVCGQPKVATAGCCTGAYWKEVKWLFTRSAHFHCFLNIKKKPKMMLTEKQVIATLNRVKREMAKQSRGR